MKKKILPFKSTIVLSIMMLTALLAMTGCSLPPFNTKSKIGYDTSVEPKFTVSAKTDVIGIPIKVENKVGAELKSLKVYMKRKDSTAFVQIGEFTETIKFAPETVTTLKINPFEKLSNDNFSNMEMIKVTGTVKDVNGNDGIELGERIFKVIVSTVVQPTEGNAEVSPKAVTDFISNIENGAVVLSWKDALNVEGKIVYHIYKTDLSNTSAAAVEFTTTATSYTDGSVAAGKEYKYTVIVENQLNSETYKFSPESRGVYVKFLTKIFYEVTSLTAVSVEKTKTIKIKWTPPTNSLVLNSVKVKGFVIYRKDANGVFKEIARLIKPNAKEYLDEDTNLKEKSSYTYKVTVLDDSGDANSEFDPDDVKIVKWPEVTVKDITAPLAPTGLTTELLEGYKIKVSWSKNVEADIKEYRLYQSTNVESFGLENVALTTTTIQGILFTYVNGIDMKNQTVYFKLRAVDGEGNLSDYSDLQIAKLEYSAKIPEPTEIRIRGGVGVASIDWKAPVTQGLDIGIVEYEVRYAKTVEALIRNTSVIVEKSKGTSLLTTNSALKDNPGTYYFAVKAIGAAGEVGKESTPKSCYIYDNVTVLSQSEVRVDPNVRGVDVKWDITIDKEISATGGGYIVLRSIGSDKIEDFDVVATIKATATDSPTVSTENYDKERKEYKFEDTSAKTFNVNYCYAIAGYKTVDSQTGLPIRGNMSGSKVVVRYPAPAQMSAPAVRSNLPNSNFISVSWDPVSDPGIAGYKVYVSRTGAGTSQYIGITGGTFMGIDVKSAEQAISIKTTATAIDMNTLEIIRNNTPGMYGVTTINKWTKPFDGDRLYYYSNVERMDGTVEQRIQYMDLEDPFLTTNVEGERRRELYFQISAINKNGEEGIKSKYTVIDLLPPKESNLGVFAGVQSITVDKNNGTKTFAIGMGCNDLGIESRYYKIYKLRGAVLPSVALTDANMHWIDLNRDGKYISADGSVVDSDEMFLGSTVGSGVQKKEILDTNSGKSPLGSWTDSETLSVGESVDIVYTVITSDESKNESGVFDFSRYMYPSTTSTAITLTLNEGNVIKMPKYEFNSITGKIEKGSTTVNYNVIAEGSVAYIDFNKNGIVDNGDYALGIIGGYAERGFGWCHLKISY